MKSYDEVILESGFDLDEYFNKNVKHNLEKYPWEFYEKAKVILQHPEDKHQAEKLMLLVKKYNYKPFG